MPTGLELTQANNIEYSWGTSNDSHCIKNKYEINDDWKCQQWFRMESDAEGIIIEITVYN